MEALMSHEETAKFLKISEQTLDREVADGKLSVIWVRGQKRYEPKDLREYLGRNKQKATTRESEAVAA
jgi:predicted site-specific integrase-resolvase